MYCEECGTGYTEKHHIVFRSQGGLDVKWNYKYICCKCHKGNNGPHLNKKRDLQYKIELQVKLNKILNQDYYTKPGIKKALGITEKQVNKITKTLVLHKEGYDKPDIIKTLMGGKLYVGA